MRRRLALLAMLAACGDDTHVEAEAGTSSVTTETTGSSTSTWTESSESTTSSTDSGSSSSSTGEVDDRGCDEMVLVPAGPFWMGCNEAVDSQCLADELPYHEVTLDAFEIDRCEVDVLHYEACMEAGICTYNGLIGNFVNCWLGTSSYDELPVNCVTWENAAAYCEWVGKRLPTEAEWEKAARGTDGRLYPWGDDTPTCDLAVMNDDEGISGCDEARPSPPGSKPAGASPYGAFDMAGNILEWVVDDYASDYYANSPLENPTGPTPAAGARKVARGGVFSDNIVSGMLRSSVRRAFDETNDATGFRCAGP